VRRPNADWPPASATEVPPPKGTAAAVPKALGAPNADPGETPLAARPKTDPAVDALPPNAPTAAGVPNAPPGTAGVDVPKALPVAAGGGVPKGEPPPPTADEGDPPSPNPPNPRDPTPVASFRSAAELVAAKGDAKEEEGLEDDIEETFLPNADGVAAELVAAAANPPNPPPFPAGAPNAFELPNAPEEAPEPADPKGLDGAFDTALAAPTLGAPAVKTPLEAPKGAAAAVDDAAAGDAAAVAAAVAAAPARAPPVFSNSSWSEACALAYPAPAFARNAALNPPPAGVEEGGEGAED
jgi:hypothetical protein